MRKVRLGTKKFAGGYFLAAFLLCATYYVQLLTCVARDICVDSQALLYWRGWAPVKRAKRRRQRDKQAAMARWRRRRCVCVCARSLAGRRTTKDHPARGIWHFSACVLTSWCFLCGCCLLFLGCHKFQSYTLVVATTL